MAIAQHKIFEFEARLLQDDLLDIFLNLVSNNV